MTKPIEKKQAVLYSGGIDSTVAAYMLAEAGSLGMLILVNGGNANFETMKRNMNWHANFLSNYCGCTVKTHVIDWDYSKLTSVPTFQEDYELQKKGVHRDDCCVLTDTEMGFLNGRNPLFMLMAATVASYNGCNRLATGFQSNQSELGMNTDLNLMRGRDACRQIHTQVNDTIFSSFAEPFLVTAPLESLTKREVIQFGISMGIDFARTQSCEYAEPCHECPICIEVDELFKELGVEL